MKYRKKPIVIEAHRWTKNGDHPNDEIEMINVGHGEYDPFPSEGKVVRYFRHPAKSGGSVCEHCRQTMHSHGWIGTLEGGHIVCPGDYIITGVKGEYYPCKPDIFAATYDLVAEVEDCDREQTVNRLKVSA